MMLSIAAMGCSIPVGFGDLRLVPSVRKDDLASGFSAGGSIMGLNLGVAMGARCFGLVSSMQGNGRCVGVGVEKSAEEQEKERKEIAAAAAPMVASTPVASTPRPKTREQLAAAPIIKDDEPERGVSGGVKLFGVGLGLSMSGRCAGLTTDVDGEARCLGVGLRPADEPKDAAAAPSRTARTSGDVRNSAPAR